MLSGSIQVIIFEISFYSILAAVFVNLDRRSHPFTISFFPLLIIDPLSHLPLKVHMRINAKRVRLIPHVLYVLSAFKVILCVLLFSFLFVNRMTITHSLELFSSFLSLSFSQICTFFRRRSRRTRLPSYHDRGWMLRLRRP